MLGKIKQFLLHNTSTRQTVAKNAFWLAVSNFGGRFLRAIVIIYAARILGAEGWGVFSYAITLVAFLTIFIDLGISSILMRETARATEFRERSKIIATSFILKSVLLALGVCVVLFVAPYVTTIEQARVIFPIVALVLVFDTLREFGFTFTRAIERMEVEAFLYILTNVAIVVFGFIALALHPTVKAFTYAYAFGTGIGMIATVYALRKNFTRVVNDFTAKLVKPILASAWPFAVSGVLGTLMVNTDVLIIGGLLSAADVGHYAAALRIIQLIYLLPAILSVATLPTFSRLARRDDEKMRHAIERVISVIFLVAIPIALGGLAIGPMIMRAVFGAEYLPAGPSFQILALTVIIDFSALILSNAIFAYDQHRKLIVYAALGGVMNVALDLILIPRFGITGSAFATLIAQLVSNAYLWHTLRKINRFAVVPHLKRMIPAGILMGFAAWGLGTLSMHAFAVIPIAALIYVGLLYAMKEPLLAEVKLILRPGTISTGSKQDYSPS